MPNFGEIFWAKFRKRKGKFLCCAHLLHKTAREIRKFHVAVGQQRLRNVQKSVQSCFFASLNLVFFCCPPSPLQKLPVVVIQAPVVRKVDSAIHWIAQLDVVILILWIAIYPVDSAIQLSNNRGQKFCYHGSVTSHFSLPQSDVIHSMAVMEDYVKESFNFVTF